MNRQQTPQPVVRPVQVGDVYNVFLNTDVFKDNVWYLANGLTSEDSGYAAAVRRVNGVMQIAVVNSDNEIWCSIGKIEGNEYTITSITHGSETLVIDDDVVMYFVSFMKCQSYEYVIAEPVNVEKFFEV